MATGMPNRQASHNQRNHLEDFFVDNQAQIGGAINSYRALVNVVGSTFQGNGGNVAAYGAAGSGAIVGAGR